MAYRQRCLFSSGLDMSSMEHSVHRRRLQEVKPTAQTARRPAQPPPRESPPPSPSAAYVSGASTPRQFNLTEKETFRRGQEDMRLVTKLESIHQRRPEYYEHSEFEGRAVAFRPTNEVRRVMDARKIDDANAQLLHRLFNVKAAVKTRMGSAEQRMQNRLHHQLRSVKPPAKLPKLSKKAMKRVQQRKEQGWYTTRPDDVTHAHRLADKSLTADRIHNKSFYLPRPPVERCDEGPRGGHGVALGPIGGGAGSSRSKGEDAEKKATVAAKDAPPRKRSPSPPKHVYPTQNAPPLSVAVKAATKSRQHQQQQKDCAATENKSSTPAPMDTAAAQHKHEQPEPQPAGGVEEASASNAPPPAETSPAKSATWGDSGYWDSSPGAQSKPNGTPTPPATPDATAPEPEAAAAVAEKPEEGEAVLAATAGAVGDGSRPSSAAEKSSSASSSSSSRPSTAPSQKSASEGGVQEQPPPPNDELTAEDGQ
jgi:hypothetical protein